MDKTHKSSCSYKSLQNILTLIHLLPKISFTRSDNGSKLLGLKTDYTSGHTSHQTTENIKIKEIRKFGKNLEISCRYGLVPSLPSKNKNLENWDKSARKFRQSANELSLETPVLLDFVKLCQIFGRGL